MPLYNFIKIIVTGELSWLVQYGNPQTVELNKSWSDIFTEYCDILPTKNTIYVRQLTGEIKHLESKIAIIQVIIDRFQVSHIPDLIPTLNEYGFYYPFTPESMLDDLLNVIAECSTFVVQKGVKEGELKRFTESQKGDAAQESDYDELLSELAKFQGYHLKTKDLSVSEFVAIFNRYKKQNS